MQYLILAALVIAGLIVGVDAIRERASRRKALHVPGLIAAAVGARSDATAPVPPWQRRWRPFPRSRTTHPGCGTSSRRCSTPRRSRRRWRPAPRSSDSRCAGATTSPSSLAPTTPCTSSFQPWEATLMEQMDGTKTTQELIVDHLQAAGDLDPAAVLGLIVALREGGFLDPARPDVQALRTDAPRSSLGRAAEAARLREEPADLLGGRRGLRGGRVPRRAQVLLPPGAGGARVPRRAGRPCRVHRRAAIGALSAVDRCRAGRDADLPRPRAVPDLRARARARDGVDRTTSAVSSARGSSSSSARRRSSSTPPTA